LDTATKLFTYKMVPSTTIGNLFGDQQFIIDVEQHITTFQAVMHLSN